MEKWKELSPLPRALLIALAAMLVIFTAVYPLLGLGKGIEYQDALLLWSAQGENDVYAGRVDGERAVFTVFPDGRMEYQYGDTRYGPYTVIPDPTAVPWNSEMAPFLTGVEVRREDEVLFRGGWYSSGDFPILVDEDGEPEPFSSITWSSGEKTSREPAVSFLLRLAAGPALTHRGEPYAYFGGTFLALVGIFTILFADELFRWNLHFRIRDPERVEPSEWELFTRYTGWVLCTAGALILYLTGASAIV